MLPVNLLNSQVKKRKSSLKIMQNINFFTDFYAARTKGKHFLSNVFHEYLFRYNQNVSKDGRTNVKFHKNTEMCIDLIVIKSYKNLLSSDGEYGERVELACITRFFSNYLIREFYENNINTVDYDTRSTVCHLLLLGNYDAFKFCVTFILRILQKLKIYLKIF